MKQIKLQRLALAVLLLGTFPLLLADETKQSTSKDREMYQKGNEAYQNKDYVSALKYLFAYRVANENDLSKHKEFSSQLDEVIENSERKIREAIKFRDEYVNREEIIRRRFDGAAL